MQSNCRLVTNGGRVLGVTGISNNLKSAVEFAYTGIKKINFDNIFYRKDIANKAIK